MQVVADDLLDDFHNRWAGNIDPVFADYAY